MSPSPQSIGIILSGAYVTSGMVSEFGRIPPAFLPLASKRLYTHQAERLRAHVGTLWLTVPDDFELEPFDAAWLKDHDVRLCPVETSKTLGEAVTYCLGQLPDGTDEVWFLFGDTLLTNFNELPLHSLAMGLVQEHSQWGYCRVAASGHIEFYEDVEAITDESRAVLAGCFRLSAPNLAYCLDISQGNFYDALGLYSMKYELSLIDKSDCWYDFGHINAYFRSRQSFTTERTFNNLQIDKRRVSKYSAETLKMLSEIEWFESIPREIGVYAPGYRGRVKHNGLIGYTTDYLFLPLVSDLFMFAALPGYVWRQIFKGCKEFLEICHVFTGPSEPAADSLWLFSDKTRDRLDQFAKERSLSLQKPWKFNGQAAPCLEDIFQASLSLVSPPSSNHISIIHGDFHFANLFFDFRALGVKAIDPRGLIKGVPTIYGDFRYDLAKLTHSVDGLYDFILAGILRAHLVADHVLEFSVETNASVAHIQDIFGSMTFNGLSPRSKEIQAIVILLFLSMLPLHADDLDRQNTLLANVFRLFFILEQGER